MPKRKFGGKQIGAGRPKGSTTKPRLSDYLTEAQINELVKKAFEMAKHGNERMLSFVLEQKFGKAMQALEVGGPDGGPMQVEVVAFTKK